MTEHTPERIPQQHTPAGWYADPANQMVQRWWDGEAWLDIPAPPSATSPARTYAPGWYVRPETGVSTWWTGSAWVEPAPVVAMKKQTNHVFHLLMSVLTLGLWIPVWIVVALSNS